MYGRKTNCYFKSCNSYFTPSITVTKTSNSDTIFKRSFMPCRWCSV
nr:MAG TPA: hypothetical protein [Caudoviricetes sp.]